MLNYIWLALIVLGIGAALTTDLVNESQNKFRNDEALPVKIYFNKPFKKDSAAEYSVKFYTSKNAFNKFYNSNIKNDLLFPADLTVKSNSKKSAVSFEVNDNSPSIWKEIAASSGDKNEINGNLKFSIVMNDTSAVGLLTLEKVSFVKMKDVTNSVLDYASTAVNIALGLIGIMALWLGVMQVAEDAGLISIIAKILKPLTTRLFPDVPSDHPAMGSMIMNISANMLGLGNAATPFGLKAMEELDNLNPEKGTATNSMVTFLAINTAGLTLIPATAIAIRAAMGSSQPAIIIGTSIFGATCATIAGVIAAKILEKFPIRNGDYSGFFRENKKILSILIGLIFLALILLITPIGSILHSVSGFISINTFKDLISILSTFAIPVIILFFIAYAAYKKVHVYERFVEGAKEGFNIAVRIIPFLVAMLMAIGIFRAGGAMDWLITILKPVTNLIGMPAEVLPMALMRPLSGSGSLGIMTDILKVHGTDSLIGIMASTFYGSTETTFYVLAVYFGAVNIRNTRHAVAAGLIADIAGILGAVFIVRLLFG